jgi:glycosyltransferase involved in cell wall biosynthesis
MREKYKISVIIPIYNSSRYINKCLKSLNNQNFKHSFEIIIIDDASSDNSIEIIKKKKLKNVTILRLKKNSGPSSARNIGIKNAKGEYIYFLDSDDTIKVYTFTKLYRAAKQNNYDIVFADKERIEKKKDQRKNIFLYKKDKKFFKKEILLELKKRFYDPLYIGGLIGCTGRLIKRSLIVKHNLFFNEKLRIREDDTFSWKMFSYVRKVKYLKKKLYSYYINPNINTAISAGLAFNISVSHYKIMSNQVKQTLKKFNLTEREIKKFSDQSFIYSIINSLISISRSILLNKIELKKGVKVRRDFIQNIIRDPEVMKSIKNYSISPKESRLIPSAILTRNSKLLISACNQRAEKILELRRKKK